MRIHRPLRTGALIALLLCVSVQASAQPAVTPTARTTPSPELDLRLGALWPQDGAEPRPLVGGRLALRPWMSVLSGRLSLQFTGDFRSFGGENGWEEFFQVRRRITSHRIVLGTAVGFDVLRTERSAVDVRAGAALVRTRTNFLIDSTQGFTFDGNAWENVCPFEGFKERCSTSYEGTVSVSVGFRHDLVRSGFTFVGADYTALGIGQHMLVGTVGMRLR
jgi:hypothetical protein